MTSARQARLTDFTDHRTPEDMELTHLGTLKTLLSEVLLLASEQRKVRQDLQIVIDRLRQGQPEEAVNPPPSSSNTWISTTGSVKYIQELAAVVNKLVDEVATLRSAVEAVDKKIHITLPKSSDSVTLPSPVRKAETNLKSNRTTRPTLPISSESRLGDLEQSLRSLQSPQLEPEVSIASEKKCRPMQNLESFVLVRRQNKRAVNAVSSRQRRWPENQVELSKSLVAQPDERPEPNSPKSTNRPSQITPRVIAVQHFSHSSPTCRTWSHHDGHSQSGKDLSSFAGADRDTKYSDVTVDIGSVEGPSSTCCGPSLPPQAGSKHDSSADDYDRVNLQCAQVLPVGRGFNNISHEGADGERSLLVNAGSGGGGSWRGSQRSGSWVAALAEVMESDNTIE